MNMACPFNAPHLSFVGSPLDQARCLLRFVKPLGNVGDAAATIPPVLSTLLNTSDSIGVTKPQLRGYLAAHGIAESAVGGSIDDPICRADSNNPSKPFARYFVIHDTSTKLPADQTFDPNFINTAHWSGNKLSNLPDNKTHIYITRLGETKTDKDYSTPWRATQFELHPPHTHFRGLFLHHELVQPRKGPGNNDSEAPNEGFTQIQYKRLALQYMIASVRRGSWMIPAFHCVLDLGVGDHDDPQKFDLVAWDTALGEIQEAILDTAVPVA